jgi:hypothetical protein
MRPGGATREKWRIPDGKVGERSDVIFKAPKVVAPHVLIKGQSSGSGEQVRLCTGVYEIYGVPQT